ncbi:MAG: hypothetical protein ACI8S6_000640 [Myxococcota bacterium]|jgi:hypothetical protein
MRDDVFSRALLATARIACCAALLACDGDGPSCDTSTTTDTATSSYDTCEETDLTDRDTCEEIVAEDFSGGEVDDDTAACCQTIAEHIDVELESGEKTDLNWEARGDCCELLDWTGSMACTPWGPPRPPSLASFSREETTRRVEAVRQAALA